MSCSLLLAVNVTEIITFLFVIITIGGGIMNFFKEKRAAAEAEQKRRQRDRRVDRNVQEELDSFLREISDDPDRPEQRQQREKQARRERMERQRSQRQRRRRKQTTRTRQTEPETAKENQAERVADRHLERHDLSTVDDRHLTGGVAERHLTSAVADQRLVSAEDAAVGTAVARDRNAVPPVLQLLQNSDGIRNAIILNEILSPPLSQRNRSSDS